MRIRWDFENKWSSKHASKAALHEEKFTQSRGNMYVWKTVSMQTNTETHCIWVNRVNLWNRCSEEIKTCKSLSSNKSLKITYSVDTRWMKWNKRHNLEQDVRAWCLVWLVLFCLFYFYASSLFFLLFCLLFDLSHNVQKRGRTTCLFVFLHSL